jgi:putative transposase
LSSGPVSSPIPRKEQIGREEALSEEQIVGFLRNAEAGMALKDLYRKHGFSEPSYYLWRRKFGCMGVPDAKRLMELETENGRLKQLRTEQAIENEAIKDALRKKC